MHFCKNCNFMYYIKTDNDNLIYYCRNCNYEDKDLANNGENLCVSKIKLNQTKSSFINKINEYTKLDPTLPRTDKIKCPNEECLSNIGKEKNEIIYMRYDDSNMKFVYLCANCDKVWKIE